MLGLGIFLDTQVDFKKHLSDISNSVNKTIGLFRKLQSILPTSSLLIIYKSFIRPLFDYGDIIYDQACNASFHQRIKSLLYNAALAITGTIKGSSSREKLFQELVLEFLQHRNWCRKLCCLFKIFKRR